MKKNIVIILALVVIATILFVPVTAKDTPKDNGPCGDIPPLIAAVQTTVSDILTKVTQILTNTVSIQTGVSILQTTMESNFAEVDTSLADIQQKLDAIPSGSHGPVIYHTGPLTIDTGQIVETSCLSTNNAGTESIDIIFSENYDTIWNTQPHSVQTLDYNIPWVTFHTVSILHSISKVDIVASSDSVVCTVCYAPYSSSPQVCYLPGDFSVERVT